MLFTDISLIDENFTLKTHQYVIVLGDRIRYIGETKPKEAYGVTIDGKDRLLMPGFYNAHAHSPMALMRGYGENMHLHDWLTKRIFPFESQLYPEAVYWATLLCMAESFQYGIVSTSDMYYFCEDMARAVEESGAKSNLSRAVTNPTGQDFASLTSVKEAVALAKTYHGAAGGRIKVDMSLHAEYTSDEETVRRLAELTTDLDLRMHVHVSETREEHEACKKRHQGRSPVRYLRDAGLFDQPTTAAHCVWVEEEDREILAEKKVTVATNPVSNLKLGSGICDVQALLDRGIPVAIGTDSVASNNNLNFLEEMKLMTLLAKVRSGKPEALRPGEALRAATRTGAEAQGRMDSGLLRQGMKADLVLLRTDRPNMNPCHDLLTNIVLSATDSDIVMTVIDGKVVYDNGAYPTVDVERARFEVEQARKAILSKL